MKAEYIRIGTTDYPVYSVNTLIIGSGAAALNAALRLHYNGIKKILIITEGIGNGTSFNAGSDKQTYYKLSSDGLTPDTPYDLAADLYSGGCMHGDIALCEAQHSPDAFYHLVRLGVPFPHDPYGAYPGYQTDHDSKSRATSAGPLTSKLMVEKLLEEVKFRKIPILDRHRVITLLTSQHNNEKQVTGAVAINLDAAQKEQRQFVLINSVNIILATGGPGALYADSVYPRGQTGATGLALQAGATARNLTETQFGIAATGIRWNLSGSYQQVIPRYFSTDQKKKDPQEFLNPFFPDFETLTTAIFLKGYQWPFDSRKIQSYGSSLIDLLVYRERVIKGRKVFIDYTANPNPDKSHHTKSFSVNNLNQVAREYLLQSGATGKTPIERLNQLNPPAVQLFLSRGIDLSKEPVEIAVCTQHQNGGLAADIWWESNIRHLFPVGEVNGSHGVYRPGGAALNAGQVGGIRAALRIARRYTGEPPSADHFYRQNLTQIKSGLKSALHLVRSAEINPLNLLLRIQNRMSKVAGPVRNPGEIEEALHEARDDWNLARNNMGVPQVSELPQAYRVLDLALTHLVYLEALKKYLRKGGGSRGSFIVKDPEGIPAHPGLEDFGQIKIDNGHPDTREKIIEITYHAPNRITTNLIQPRPIPHEKQWFETLYNSNI